MLLFVLGFLLGWAVVGSFDYVACRRAMDRAYQAGEDDTYRRVSSW